MTPKDHYVPEFYLKGFVDPATNQLWVVDLNLSSIRPDSPGNVARISGYDNLQGNIIKDRSVASKALKAIETQTAPIIAKLRNHEFRLTFEERDKLSNFIGLQIGRVPIFRNFVNKRMDEVLNERLRETVLSDTFESKYGKDAEMIRQRVLSGKYPARLKFKEPFDKTDGVLLSSLVIGHKFSSLIFGMNWLFLITRESGAFFTSDNPARLLSPKSESATIDFNKPDVNLEISFPISPSCALIASYHNDSQYSIVSVDSGTVDELNKRVLPTVDKYIYCCKKEQAVQILSQFPKTPA